MTKKDKIKVLFVASEVAPFSKTGGLGDVAGSLPSALRARDADARVVFPKYKTIKPETIEKIEFVTEFTVHLSWRSQPARVYSVPDPNDGAPAYLIENDFYFGRDGLYGYGDDFERFAFFSKAAVEMLSHINFKANILHFNDWQTGLGCTYLRDIYKGFTFYSGMKSLFTIHNLHYQGVFNREVLWSVGLDDGYYTGGTLEFYKNVSFLKAGVVHSDAVLTVSQTYAEEIQTPKFGYGMDGLLWKRGLEGRLLGIGNGIDTKANDPATDKRIYVNYDKTSLKKKRENKYRLQEQLGLPVGDMPMISMVTRLVDQKGIDIIDVAQRELFSKDIQFVMIGTGEGRYERMFWNYASWYPQKVRANICFDDTLATRIYAASDLFLMPSKYEPGGLGQLFAMCYGSVPIVRQTGGLADTVRHFNPATGQGNGFVFKDYDASGLMWAVNEALTLYGTDKWETVITNGMSEDFSWNKSAGEYLQLYEKILHS
ncbi:MAG: glycogen synthase [Clostridiales bacterium]|jgi:starch synthase|nr:glycogen synthase [Clostridiales bacterium]